MKSPFEASSNPYENVQTAASTVEMTHVCSASCDHSGTGVVFTRDNIGRDHKRAIGGSEGLAKSYRKSIDIRLDLVPASALRRLGAIYEEGAVEYGPSSYLKPHRNVWLSTLMNHMLNHYTLYLTGDRSEDHLAKCAWAFLTAMALEEAKPDFNDMGQHGIRPDAETAVDGRI